MNSAQQVHRRATRLIAALITLGLLTAGCGSSTSTANPDPVPTAAPTSEPAAPEPTSVATLEPVVAPTETPVAPANDQAIFTSYEFPSGLIETPFGGRPTQVQGVLGVPAGPGPFPVAIILHGSHPPCVTEFDIDAFSDRTVTETVPPLCTTSEPAYVRHDIGLGYIVEALSARGIASVAIDVNSAYIWWDGEPDEHGTIEFITSLHHDMLTRLNRGEDLGLGLASLEGRLALDDVSVIGHSRGGMAAFQLTGTDRTIPFMPRSVAMIEPSEPYIEGTTDAVPTLLIRGGCDEDVGPETTLQFVTDGQPNLATTTVVDLNIPGAGHRMLNTGLTGSLCPGELDPTLAQAQTGQAVASFIASNGTELDIVAGANAVATTIHGAAPTWTDVEPTLGYDPTAVPFAVSDLALLPPWPADADYSSVFDEDF